jgi:hypothetical protein
LQGPADEDEAVDENEEDDGQLELGRGTVRQVNLVQHQVPKIPKSTPEKCI